MQLGVRLGPYEVVAPIGAGGMGEVYRARDTRLGRDVAIKVLPTEFAADPDRLRRFEQEARAVAAVDHPNILAIHDVDLPPGCGTERMVVLSVLPSGRAERSQVAGRSRRISSHRLPRSRAGRKTPSRR